GASLARVQRPCMRRRSRACAAPVRMLCFGTAPRRTAMEFRLIDRIRERTAQTRDDVRLGIGDDAALLAVPAGQELAVAIDTLVEGVHFPVGTAPADVGWKALAVNLSDLAAMGATPAWALLALTLPRPDAAAGLRCLQPHMDVQTSLRDALVERLNRPVPRLAAGLALRGRASACID